METSWELPEQNDLEPTIISRMQFLAANECSQWIARHGFEFPVSQHPLPNEPHEIIVPMALLWPRTAWFSLYLALSMGEFTECLLWVTLWDVWPSSENPHLFGRVRSSYSEARSLADAPGHLFAPDERDDLRSFIQLSLLNVWDFHLLAQASPVRIFVSHDGFVHFFVRDLPTFESLRAELTAAKVTFRIAE